MLIVTPAHSTLPGPKSTTAPNVHAGVDEGRARQPGVVEALRDRAPYGGASRSRRRTRRRATGCAGSRRGPEVRDRARRQPAAVGVGDGVVDDAHELPDGSRASRAALMASMTSRTSRPNPPAPTTTIGVLTGSLSHDCRLGLRDQGERRPMHILAAAETDEGGEHGGSQAGVRPAGDPARLRGEPAGPGRRRPPRPARLGAPVLFRQQRPGLHGEPFEMVKFRTMLDPDPARGLVDDA